MVSVQVRVRVMFYDYWIPVRVTGYWLRLLVAAYLFLVRVRFRVRFRVRG